MKFLVKLLTLITLLISTACSYRPILDPNPKYLEAGEKRADADVDQCLAEAKEYLKKYKAARAAKEAVRKGVIGSAIGAVSGALSRGNLKSTLSGGLIGAGIGAFAGAALAAGEDKIQPDEIKQRYTNNCLAMKGYNVLGWQ